MLSMEADKAGEFARVRILGVGYTCYSGEAVAYCWDPQPEEEVQVEVPEAVVANRREFKVRTFVCGIFSRTAIRSIAIPNTVTALPKKCFEYVNCNS